MTQQQGIVKGDAQQKLGSAGFIIGAILMTVGSFLLPPSLGVSRWMEEIKQVGQQAMLLQSCALLITFGYWGVLVGTAGVYRSITASGAAWARLGFYFHLMGTALWTIGMAVGDVGIPAAAANWLAAPPASQEAAFSVITAMTGFTRGLFPMEVIILWLAFIFLGIGMVQSAVYPRWLGWVGLVLGLAGVSLGVVQTFNGLESTLALFMVLNVSTILWMVVTGIWVARKAW